MLLRRRVLVRTCTTTTAATKAASSSRIVTGALCSSCRWRSTSRTRAADARRPTPLTSTSAVHLYSNKYTASSEFEPDRFALVRSMRDHMVRLFGVRVFRYYVLTVLVVLVGAVAVLTGRKRRLREAAGLVGPRRRAYRSRLTVVLDVDETILSFGDKAFHMSAGLVPRPYLAELLDYLVSIDAEVILWAACSERYMLEVLRVIDPNGHRISHYIARDSLWFSGERFYEKNLQWLQRPRADTLLIENRALSVRNCNANALLVEDFVRGEYMDTGHDWPENDTALHTITQIIADLERSGRPVYEYLADAAHRHPAIQSIPCHYAIQQLPDELARGVFYFIGNKYKPANEQHVVQLAAEQRGVL